MYPQHVQSGNMEQSQARRRRHAAPAEDTPRTTSKPAASAPDSTGAAAPPEPSSQRPAGRRDKLLLLVAGLLILASMWLGFRQAAQVRGVQVPFRTTVRVSDGTRSRCAFADQDLHKRGTCHKSSPTCRTRSSTWIRVRRDEWGEALRPGWRILVLRWQGRYSRLRHR